MIDTIFEHDWEARGSLLCLNLFPGPRPEVWRVRQTMSPVSASSLPGLHHFCHIKLFLEIWRSLFIVHSPSDPIQRWNETVPTLDTRHSNLLYLPSLPKSLYSEKWNILSSTPHCLHPNPSIYHFVTLSLKDILEKNAGVAEWAPCGYLNIPRSGGTSSAKRTLEFLIMSSVFMAQYQPVSFMCTHTHTYVSVKFTSGWGFSPR